MKKYSPLVRWKNILYASLFLLLLSNMTTAGVSAYLATSVSVDPPTTQISEIGETTTIEISATNVVDFYGYDLWVSYNDTLLDVTSVTEKGSGQMCPPQVGNYTFFDTSVSGTVRVAVGFIEAQGAEPFNGNGTLLWITFTGIALGVGSIDIVDAQTKWVNSLAMEFSFDSVSDGSIEVVPEFPAAIVIPLLLIATLAAALLGKIVWSRKRRGPLNIK